MTTKPLLIATTNPGKIKEFEQILMPLGFSITSLIESDCPEIEETGLSFIENAIIKARTASAYAGTPALADDSGLCVEALNGAPGIYSARYAGPNASAQDNNQKLLAAMASVKDGDRDAYFFCALAFVKHPEDPCPVITTGRFDGSITRQLSGIESFGYNPLFYVPNHSCTLAELDSATRNQLTHRSVALKKMQSLLNTLKI